jgi:DNA repair exonuclease SbcCD nuclease subunit
MLLTPSIIKKIALFTDIHFGRRSNSRIHNQDCLGFVEWFCVQVRADPTITHIAFLGDWFESRSAINIETMDFSYMALKLLDSLNLPIFFIVGNHDLHRRTTREIHSVRMFQELKNFTVIDKPTVYDNVLFSPFLFEHEYLELIKHNDLYAFFGHFEFQNFFITGYNTLMEHGPSHKMFPGPKKIFSGHFHKRQAQDNVLYIGNAFPMDMGDADDFDRGMTTYVTADDKVAFSSWPDQPTYHKTTLSKVTDEKWSPKSKMKVKCIVDTDISYTDAQDLREAMIELYDLRDFVLEEDREAKQGLVEGTTTKAEEIDIKFDSVDELVISQLKLALEDKAFKDKYDVQLLIDTYSELKVEVTEGTDE